MPSNVISFRLSKAQYDWLVEAGVNNHMSAAQFAKALVVERMDVPAPPAPAPEVYASVIIDNVTGLHQDVDAEGQEVGPVKGGISEKGEENALAKAAALKLEWRRLVVESPAIALEYGSFDEYERRHSG